MLTEKEASALSEDGEVVSVFPDPILKLHTTRSWDFLEPPPRPPPLLSPRPTTSPLKMSLLVLLTLGYGRSLKVSRTQGLGKSLQDGKGFAWSHMTSRNPTVIGSLDPEKVKGKIIACIYDDPTVPRRIRKLVVEDAKAKGLILVNGDEKGVPFDSGIFAFAQVDNKVASQIINYINSTKNPTATILPTVDVVKYRPAPVIAYFSSRATMYDNLGKPMTNNIGNYANPHEMGVGETSPLKALNPGLVFETTTVDYFKFLCYFGYSEKTIRSVTNRNFNCPNISNDKLISNINYPSISISNLDRHRGGVRSIRRAVTNVGSPNATYIARVHAPSGLLVKIQAAAPQQQQQPAQKKKKKKKKKYLL
ncbi:hypothetical protein LWI29_006775 [Acer saccharum]|uniref:Subtilisin-like protease fibronectin type-III domain-containing protein n=1 Tax=Acer saccharum TaxID=4024 RepID=A0AA39VYW0_ACESA|nr:hypothetical protein LWI29_006775 [Acer saccharum]